MTEENEILDYLDQSSMTVSKLNEQCGYSARPFLIKLEKKGLVKSWSEKGSRVWGIVKEDDE